MSIFLCYDLTNECACCGGSATLGGTQEAIESPRGKALRYCSVECFDSWEEYLDQQDKARSEDWCPTCGYDRHEHATDCADYLAHLREKAEKPHLYGPAKDHLDD